MHSFALSHTSSLIDGLMLITSIRLLAVALITVFSGSRVQLCESNIEHYLPSPSKRTQPNRRANGKGRGKGDEKKLVKRFSEYRIHCSQGKAFCQSSVHCAARHLFIPQTIYEHQNKFMVS